MIAAWIGLAAVFYLALITMLAWFFAYTAARRRAGDRAATQTPAPGRPHGPPVPVPAPAPGHGGLLKREEIYVCGRKITYHYDRGTRTLTHGCSCAPHVDWDEEMERLLKRPPP